MIKLKGSSADVAQIQVATRVLAEATTTSPYLRKPRRNMRNKGVTCSCGKPAACRGACGACYSKGYFAAWIACGGVKPAPK
jgi:hypothetical protein